MKIATSGAYAGAATMTATDTSTSTLIPSAGLTACSNGAETMEIAAAATATTTLPGLPAVDISCIGNGNVPRACIPYDFLNRPKISIPWKPKGSVNDKGRTDPTRTAGPVKDR